MDPSMLCFIRASLNRWRCNPDRDFHPIGGLDLNMVANIAIKLARAGS
jgi:hypothetical protein